MGEPESGGREKTERSRLVQKRPSRRFLLQKREEAELRRSFFRIGCGSSITFNAVVMGVAYLRTLFGTGVLRELSMAHNTALLGSLAALTTVGARDASPFDSPRTCGVLLQWALAFAAVFNGAMLCAIALVDVDGSAVGETVDADGAGRPMKRALVACIGVNGVATAVVQGVGATFGGHLDRRRTTPRDAEAGTTEDDGAATARAAGRGRGASTSSAQLSGAGLGVLAPTLTQLLCVAPSALAANASGVRDATRAGAALGAALGLVATGV